MDIVLTILRDSTRDARGVGVFFLTLAVLEAIGILIQSAYRRKSRNRKSKKHASHAARNRRSNRRSR